MRDATWVDETWNLRERDNVFEEPATRREKRTMIQTDGTYGLLIGLGPKVPSSNHENGVRSISASTADTSCTSLIQNEAKDAWIKHKELTTQGEGPYMYPL